MTLRPSGFYSMETAAIANNEMRQHSSRLGDIDPPENGSRKTGAGMLNVAIRFTIATTILLGIAYPLVVTGLAQLMMREKAEGQIITRSGQIVGSELIGQSFVSDRYFHGRPSAAGNGYDATSSGGSNLGPTNKKLIDRISTDVTADEKQNPGAPVPIDLVTTSASGLDPDITPASAFYQVPRIAAARHLSEEILRTLIQSHIQGRQFGVFGEPRVNVLELNIALDGISNKMR